MTQAANIHRQNDKTFDFLFTNVPSHVNRVEVMPPIGKATHNIVYAMILKNHTRSM